ncbi:YqaA family protein [Williamwhitmania taraxaci]|uniref:Membrane protein YqaA, SNARE-associated domain n=1 Tax=Williamwhitmania taraxaci TaxID=1640674 RepID=A0A1G6GW25_9BACT|nr:VTT domain-containing protein [Williamwhitmania taraxaci]SDB86164.1 membrane protein YqaA, SNARE-associated domain [Williamwhitmania taraxaci]
MICWITVKLRHKSYRTIELSMIKYKKVVAINRYYRITKFYPFLKEMAIKGGLTIVGLVALLVFLEIFFIDINGLLNQLVVSYSPKVILFVFFVSETFLGLLPPEIFIAWSSKSAVPWLLLSIIASLSYLGGIVAYALGKTMLRIPAVKLYLETKIATHIKNLRKWGGFFVVVGAMLPLPHSVVSLACGLIQYKFSHYLMWALFRFLRFGLYALVIFKIF